MHEPSSRDDEGIVPYKFYYGFRKYRGIATPVCGLVRNDNSYFSAYQEKNGL